MTKAGTHLIIDLYDVPVEQLQDMDFLDNVIRKACRKAGATILHSHFHHFGEGHGVTGVVVLAESHASIHTWPEKDGYAAIDFFMCGKCDPEVAAEYVLEHMKWGEKAITTMDRG